MGLIFIAGTFTSVALLWLLITIFTRATSSSDSLTETWIVIIGMQIVHFFSRFLLVGLIGPFVFLVELAALYILVDRVCEIGRPRTIRICLWYVGLSFLMNLIFVILWK